MVSIPFNRLDLDNDVQDDVQDNLDYITPDQIESKILELCTTARSALEITDNLRIKGRKTVSIMRVSSKAIAEELLEMTFRKDNGLNEYQLPLDII